MSAALALPPGVTEEMRPYRPQGAHLDAMYAHDEECLEEGPAGTGKSICLLNKLHACAEKYAGMRGLILRKTRASLTESGLVTWEREVVPPARMRNFGNAQRRMRQSYIYPNRSEIVVGGIDMGSRIMSTQYDIIYVQEATELTEGDWEDASSRLRHNVMPYQQLIADCNPQSPSHWLNRRCIQERTRRIVTRHSDNPALWDEEAQGWTALGVTYRARLGRLTGVREARLNRGLWAAAEGLVYETFDARIHIVDAAPAARRTFAAVDWGFTNPGCIQVWQCDNDDRLYRVREYFMTGKLIGWWVAVAQTLQDIYHIEAFACDPAEPGNIAEFRKAGLNAIPAINDIALGVQKVQERLQVAADGRPRLMLVRDALAERDESLAADGQPINTEGEFESYVWPKDAEGKSKRETPVDAYNHGLDTLRYAVAYRDLDGGTPYAGAVAPPRPVTTAIQRGYRPYG